MKENKNTVYRTRVYYIIPSQELINEARLSNNLYNQALYILRQAFINEEKIPSKFDLINMLRHKEYECEKYNNFSKMISDNADRFRRIHRGLFVSSKGKRINADVNSAYQIMKKVIGDKVIKPIGKGSIFISRKVTMA